MKQPKIPRLYTTCLCAVFIFTVFFDRAWSQSKPTDTHSPVNNGHSDAIFSMVPRQASTLTSAGKIQHQTEDAITIAGHIELFDGYCYTVTADNGIAYYGEGNIMRIVDVSDPSKPRSLSSFEVMYRIINDICIADGYAYIANHLGGLYIVDISNPSAPREVCHTACSAMAIALSDNKAYVADYYEGLRIYSLEDMSEPVEIGHCGGRESAMGMCLSGDYVYMTFCLYGLVIIDVSDPTSPFEASCIRTGGDAMTVDVADGFAYVADRDTGLRIIDISDPVNPEEAGFFSPEGTAKAVILRNDTVYMVSGDGGLRILDVEDPMDVEVIECFETNDFAQDLCIADDHIYLAEWVQGIFILDYDDMVGIEEARSTTMIPQEGFRLLQNHPNPCNTATTIGFDLERPGRATLCIYNMTGQKVRVLADGFFSAGAQFVEWDGYDSHGRKVPSGIYIYSLRIGNSIRTRKLVVTQ